MGLAGGLNPLLSVHEELETQLLRRWNSSKNDVSFIFFKKGRDRRTQLILSEKITRADTCGKYAYFTLKEGVILVRLSHKQGEL
jgi:hypothetical protein